MSGKFIPNLIEPLFTLSPPSGSFKSSESQEGGIDPIIINAFTQAARNLLADEKFRNIVVRGGETVKETTFKTADGFIITPGKSKPFHKQADEWKEGVVTIFAGKGHGSGFAIGENLILTNHHVIGESDKVVVKLGAGFEISGDVIAYNSAYVMWRSCKSSSKFTASF